MKREMEPITIIVFVFVTLFMFILTCLYLCMKCWLCESSQHGQRGRKLGNRSTGGDNSLRTTAVPVHDGSCKSNCFGGCKCDRNSCWGGGDHEETVLGIVVMSVVVGLVVIAAMVGLVVLIAAVVGVDDFSGSGVGNLSASGDGNFSGDGNGTKIVL